MDFLEDTSLRISFFNSIFELLAGYNFAYAGLHMVSHFINSHLIKTAHMHQKNAKRLYFEAISSVAVVMSSLPKNKSEELESYLKTLNQITDKYSRYYFNTRILNVKTKIKFIPGFIFSGFYCFYVLLLSGIAESSKKIYLNQSIEIAGIFSLKQYVLILFSIFNFLYFSYLLYIYLRNKEDTAYSVRFKQILPKSLLFIYLSILVALLLYFILDIVFKNELSNRLAIEGTYSVRGYAFTILLFYNIACCFYLFYIYFRDWKRKDIKNKVVLIPARQLFFKSTTYFGSAITFSFVLCFIFEFHINDSTFFELLMIIWSIIIGISPILSLTFWIFGGHRIKFSVHEDIIEAICYEIHSKISPFAKNKFTSHKAHVPYLNAINNPFNLKLLRIKRFFGLYINKLLILALFSSVILLILYSLIMPQENKLVEFVKMSATKENQTYKLLPKVDTAWFDNYYCKNGEVRRKIKERIAYHLKRKETLTNNGNPSDFEFINGEILDVNNDRVIIRTYEYWSNKWYNSILDKYTFEFNGPAYEAQIYILKKENGKWLIDKNSYVGNTNYPQ